MLTIEALFSTFAPGQQLVELTERRTRRYWVPSGGYPEIEVGVPSPQDARGIAVSAGDSPDFDAEWNPAESGHFMSDMRPDAYYVDEDEAETGVPEEEPQTLRTGIEPVEIAPTENRRTA